MRGFKILSSDRDRNPDLKEWKRTQVCLQWVGTTLQALGSQPEQELPRAQREVSRQIKSRGQMMNILRLMSPHCFGEGRTWVGLRWAWGRRAGAVPVGKVEAFEDTPEIHMLRRAAVDSNQGEHRASPTHLHRNVKEVRDFRAEVRSLLKTANLEFREHN